MNAIKRTFGFIHEHPLAKRHLLRAYFKFISWQIRSRLTSGFQKVKFINGIHFFAKSGLTGITGNIYTGLHEFNDMGFLLHFLRNEDTFFDVGANVGAYTLLASGVCRSKTISFEPVPTTYHILKKNINLNKLNDLVTIENKGVGSEEGNLRFTAEEDTTNHVILEDQEHQNSILVPIVFLDNYYPANNPALIKIDVEGFETAVLKGADQILNDKALKAIIIELNGSGGRYGYDDNQIHAKLLSHGFKPYEYHPIERKIEELDTFGTHNTIYIRDLAYVVYRLKSAVPFTIFNQSV
ncbi:FkbM family methyltransferase [Pedobacter chinensis]|uniref:FkbM family methyltransferase n=1 Tax=Pedobacter chinensis TaxID=2282421 RepID=A0A369PVC0_9SPHI|nr:FkbM family methyltransferase [Pedobacter chinensis]RDC56210.1 FkbM family methyltransferase [Pedobacter chinensis]